MAREVRKPHWPSYARSLKREAKKLDMSKADKFKLLKKRARAIEDPYYSAMAFSWIGARMAEVGLESETVFSSALEKSRSTEPEWRRAEILLHIASEMSKTGSIYLQELFDAAAGLDEAELRVKTLKEMKRRMARKGVDLSGLEAYKQGDSEKKIESQKNSPPPSGCKSKIALGLYNTYEGKTIKDNHIRAIARAAPLCIAFNLKLALFNFPVKNLAEFVKTVESQTRLKESKHQITVLYNRGCISLKQSPNTPISSDLGVFVSTTSHPDPEKMIGLEKLLEVDEQVCFLMGLGSRGLPKKVLNVSKFHLELTGKNVSLETCTAMGVLVCMINKPLPKHT
jgi:hypothetical protein